MDKLRLALKLVTAKSRAEKAILSLASDTGLNSSFDKPVNTLLEIFSNERQLHEDHASFDMLLKYLKKSNSWSTSIKLLFAAHCLMIKIGTPFCRAFTREEFDNIHNFSKTKQGLYSIYEVMTANYYSFLVCFANYYEEIEKLSHKRSQEIVKSIKNNEPTYLSQLLNLNELTKYVTKIEACIKESLALRKYKYLFEKIASMIIRETTIVNNIITDVLEESKDFIFKADPKIAFMLDELYSNTIQNTKKLKPFLDELDLPYSSNVTPMKYFEFDPDFNHQEELYILELKKSHPDPYQKHQTEKSNRREILSPSEIQYSKQHDIEYKQPRKIDAPGIQIKKAGTRSPLRERRNVYEKDLISPEPSDRKNFLKVGAISPEVSSPSSTDLLNDNQRLEGDSIQGPDEESIYKSRGFLSESGANVKGKEGNLMKKKAVVPEKENFENNDLYSTDLVS